MGSSIINVEKFPASFSLWLWKETAYRVGGIVRRESSVSSSALCTVIAALMELKMAAMRAMS